MKSLTFPLNALQHLRTLLKPSFTQSEERSDMMAASVIRTLSGFGPSLSDAQTFFVAADEDDVDEEFEEELRDSVEEEEDDSSCVTDPYAEMTERLLRFAELISGDVRRYFGRSWDSDARDVYSARSGHEVSGRQRYYSHTVRTTSSERRDQPENLGPLAELFQSAQVKKQGLPMMQRRLPSSFWTEPRPEHLHVSANDLLTCSTETTNANYSIPAMNISSSSTPDFTDLLEHWTTDRDTGCTYSYSQYQLT